MCVGLWWSLCFQECHCNSATVNSNSATVHALPSLASGSRGEPLVFHKKLHREECVCIVRGQRPCSLDTASATTQNPRFFEARDTNKRACPCSPPVTKYHHLHLRDSLIDGHDIIWLPQAGWPGMEARKWGGWWVVARQSEKMVTCGGVCGQTFSIEGPPGSRHGRRMNMGAGKMTWVCYECCGHRKRKLPSPDEDSGLDDHLVTTCNNRFRWAWWCAQLTLPSALDMHEFMLQCYYQIRGRIAERLQADKAMLT